LITGVTIITGKSAYYNYCDEINSIFCVTQTGNNFKTKVIQLDKYLFTVENKEIFKTLKDI